MGQTLKISRVGSPPNRWKYLYFAAEASCGRSPSKTIGDPSEPSFKWSLTFAGDFYGRFAPLIGTTAKKRRILKLAMTDRGTLSVQDTIVGNAPQSLAHLGQISFIRSETDTELLASQIKDVPVPARGIADPGARWVQNAIQILQKIGHVRTMNINLLFQIASHRAAAFLFNKNPQNHTFQLIYLYDLSASERMERRRLADTDCSAARNHRLN